MLYLFLNGFGITICRDMTEEAKSEESEERLPGVEPCPQRGDIALSNRKHRGEELGYNSSP